MYNMKFKFHEIHQPRQYNIITGNNKKFSESRINYVQSYCLRPIEVT